MLLIKKAIILLLCVPAYPFIIFAIYYDKTTSYGGKFNLRKANAEYWSDVYKALTYKEDD